MEIIKKGTKIRMLYITSRLTPPFIATIEEDLHLLDDYTNQDERLLFQYEGRGYISDKIERCWVGKDKIVEGKIVRLRNVYCIETEEEDFYFEVI